jgi:hypothetical protein
LGPVRNQVMNVWLSTKHRSNHCQVESCPNHKNKFGSLEK